MGSTGNIISRALRHDSIELKSGGDVHTTLRDPGGFKSAIGRNIEIEGKVVDHRLVRIPFFPITIAQAGLEKRAS